MIERRIEQRGHIIINKLPDRMDQHRGPQKLAHLILMKNMDRPLEHDKTREATLAIRGYVYQAYQSVLAWMRLREEEVLFLEAAEDFDVHERDLTVVTQVKDTSGSGSITLRSSDAVDAINNYWRHKQLNPDRTIRLRFLTTAAIGQEKGIAFPEAGKGIHYWMLLARDELDRCQAVKGFFVRSCTG